MATSAAPSASSFLTSKEGEETTIHDKDVDLERGESKKVDDATSGTATPEAKDETTDNPLATQDSGVKVPLGRTQFVLVFLGLALAILLAALDQTIVSTALKAIVNDLNDQNLIPWIGSAYLMTATAFAALYGKFADIFGRKWVFVTAIIIFEAGSALCGAAPTMEWLIVGRAVAGAGGGGIFSLVLIIISDIVSMQDRGKFQGVLGGVFGLASVIGPLVGGAFADKVSWRWCFFINVPVGAITVATVITFLRFPPPEGSAKEKLGRIDFLGSFLLFAFVVSLITPVQLGGSSWAWNSAPAISMFVVAAAFLGAFIFVELKVSKEPIIPASLFMNYSVPAFLLIAVWLGAAFFSAVYYISLFFQVVYGDSATQAGVETIPLVFGVVILSILSGQIVSRTGKYVPFVYIGGCVMVAGSILTSTLSPSSGRVQQVFYLLILGLGVGCLIQIRVLGIQASVDGPRIAIATAVSTFCQTLGGAIGVALIGGIFNNVLVKNVSSKPTLLAFLESKGMDPGDLNLPVVRGMLSSTPGQDQALGELIDAFAGAFSISYKIIVVFPILILVCALFIKQAASDVMLPWPSSVPPSRHIKKTPADDDAAADPDLQGDRLEDSPTTDWNCESVPPRPTTTRVMTNHYPQQPTRASVNPPPPSPSTPGSGQPSPSHHHRLADLHHHQPSSTAAASWRGFFSSLFSNHTAAGSQPGAAEKMGKSANVAVGSKADIPSLGGPGSRSSSSRYHKMSLDIKTPWGDAGGRSISAGAGYLPSPTSSDSVSANTSATGLKKANGNAGNKATGPSAVPAAQRQQPVVGRQPPSSPSMRQQSPLSRRRPSSPHRISPPHLLASVAAASAAGSTPSSRSASPAPSVSSILAAERLARLSSAQLADLASQVKTEFLRRRTPVGSLLSAFESTVATKHGCHAGTHQAHGSAATRLSAMTNDQFYVLANDLDAEAQRRDLPGIDTLNRANSTNAPRALLARDLADIAAASQQQQLQAPSSPSGTETPSSAASTLSVLTLAPLSPLLSRSLSSSVPSSSLNSSPPSPSALSTSLDLNRRPSTGSPALSRSESATSLHNLGGAGRAAYEDSTATRLAAMPAQALARMRARLSVEFDRRRKGALAAASSTPAPAAEGGGELGGFMESVMAAVQERITTTGAGNAAAVGVASSALRMEVATAKQQQLSGASSASVALAGPPSKRVDEAIAGVSMPELIVLREEVEAEMSRRGVVVDEVEEPAAVVTKEVAPPASVVASAAEAEVVPAGGEDEKAERVRRREKRKAVQETDEQRQQREAREEANVKAWRSRIARLADDQMVEVSSDVRDEMIRRKEKNAPFLAPRSDLSPKRNEARKELSKLPSRELKMLYSIIHESMKERKKTAVDGAKNDTAA
ncbi:hypothetical protein HK101_003723 [Irineochytrium annulatum]|nr:hypothetical protein HK101_003723 [Irineochytrium annulatum]